MDCLNDFQLFSEGKLYSSTSLIISNYCISYRSHPASRRNVRAYSGARRGFFSEAQVNSAELTEITNLNLEEPQFTNPIDTTTGNIPIL